MRRVDPDIGEPTRRHADRHLLARSFLVNLSLPKSRVRGDPETAWRGNVGPSNGDRQETHGRSHLPGRREDSDRPHDLRDCPTVAIEAEGEPLSPPGPLSSDQGDPPVLPHLLAGKPEPRLGNSLSYVVGR